MAERTRSSASRTVANLLVALAIGILLVVAYHLREPRFAFPASRDEIGTVPRIAEFWAIFWDDETAVNPPLWRWLSLGASPGDAIARGRVLSFVMSLASVPLAWFAGAAMLPRRHSWAGPLVGCAFAALVTLHPWLVAYAVVNRVYPAWVALTLVLFVLASRATMPLRTGSWLAVGGVSIVLCWLHYLAVPALIGAALAAFVDRRKSLALALIVGPASIVFLIARLLGRSHSRVAPPSGAVTVDDLARWLSFDLAAPSYLLNHPWGRSIRAVVGDALTPSLLIALAVLVALLTSCMAWRRLAPTARLATGGAIALVLGLVVVGRVQYVRPITVVMVLTWLAPVVLTAPFVLRSRALALLSVIGLGGFLFAELPHRTDELLTMWEERRSPIELIALAPHWADVRGDDVIVVWPLEMLSVIRMEGTGTIDKDGETLPACKHWQPCLVLDGIPYVGLRDPLAGDTINGIVVTLEHQVPDTLAAACAPLHRAPGLHAWACGAVAQRLAARKPLDALDPP